MSGVGILGLLTRYPSEFGPIFSEDFYSEEELVEGKSKIKVLTMHSNAYE